MTDPPEPNPSAPETMLRIRDLSLAYGGLMVLEGVELALRRGEFWFLLGPNGSGKTTLLHAILGELAPRRGRVERHARLATREGIGFVPQRCDLNPTLPTTVEEFVLLGLVGLRADAPERRRRLEWALERVGLGGRERADYWSLSGGQRQRALLARALVRRPVFLILDEPTAGLDLPACEALLDCLDALNRDQALTILLVTHNLGSAPRHASHIALCARGQIIAGPARDVFDSAKLERAYGVPLRVSAGPGGALGVAIAETGS
jgi:zinc transport system ATP-binding protein